MSVVIVGGNECMVCQYKELCREYKCKAKIYPKMAGNLKNIGLLCNSKNIYFVPFGQDNYQTKPNSLVAHVELLIPTLEMALEHRQYQPILKDYIG